MKRPYKVFIVLSLMVTCAGLGLIALEAALQVKQKALWGELLSAVVQRVQIGGNHPQRKPETKQTAQTETEPTVPTPDSPATERVNLPDVEGHFWLTFLYQDNWQSDPETVRLHNMFLSDPRLVEMRKRCRVNSFSQMDPYLTERWQKYVGTNMPMVVLQSPAGRLCYKASRGNIPATPAEMTRQVQQSLDECFRRPCPQPNPTPSPRPEPAPLTPVSPLPDTIGPAEEPQDAGDPLWLLPALGIAGATGGALLGRKRK